jgi:branched-chain amino acid transport system substrate-binding protein
MNRKIAFAAVATGALIALAAPADADVRIAQIDGVSGAFGNIGTQQTAALQATIDVLNAQGGVGGEKFTLVTIDGKGNPQDTLTALREAVNQGIRIVTQGNSSSVAAALVDAVAKHNKRNPDDPVLYLDHSALDNELTDSKCNFWHFRFDASVAMKTKVIMKKLATDQRVHKIYLINQNYALGQQASANAKQLLTEFRPDVSVVGDELHPVGQVKDFSPYVSKIAESGADTIFTANWGNDLALLVKAIRDAGLDVNIYTFYGSGYGAPAAMGDAAIGHVYVASEWNQNLQPNPIEAFMAAYQQKTGYDWLFHHIRTMLFLLDDAMQKAGTTEDIKKIAYALEDARTDAGTGPAWVRKNDHQVLQRFFISRAVKLASADGPAEAKYGAEHSGTAFVTDMVFEPQDTAMETSCKMERP